MRIAGHTLATPDEDLPNALNLFARLGVDGVEIVQDDAYRCGLPERPSTAYLVRLRRMLDDLGLRAVHLTPYVRTLDSLDDAQRRDAIERMRASITASSVLGATGVRTLAGRKETPGRADREARFMLSLQELTPTARDAGVSLNIETKGWSFADDTSNTLRILEHCDSSTIGIAFDPANLVVDGHDPVEAYMEQAVWIRHVHVKDVRVVAPGEAQPVALGQGHVPWRDILATLQQQGYNGYLSLEHERRWHPEALPPAREAYPVDKAYLRGLLRAVNPGPR